MRTTISLVGALALLGSTAAPALAQPWPPGQGSYPLPGGAPRPFTEVRVAPPPGGMVYVYEGHRLLARFEQPGSMMVPTGQSYRVVTTRGDQQIWTGNVTASGWPIDLRWGAEDRRRETMPPAYQGSPAYPMPYSAPAYPQAGGVEEQVISSSELRTLLQEIDGAPDDMDRLEALAGAAQRHAFAVPQAAFVLARFRSDAFRLAALERLRDRLVERGDAQVLLNRFQHSAARAQARDMLGL